MTKSQLKVQKAIIFYAGLIARRLNSIKNSGILNVHQKYSSKVAMDDEYYLDEGHR